VQASQPIVETPKPQGALSVLVVEDDPSWRAALADALGAIPDIHVSRWCGSRAEAERALAAAPAPDVLLVDLGLPDGSGIDVIRAAHRRHAELAILVLSIFSDERRVLDAIRAGARGYVLKSERPDNLARAIRDTHAGLSPISPEIAGHILQSLRADGAVEDGDAGLSAREREVLTVIAKGFTAAEAGRMLGMAASTVRTHVRNIYRKLEVGSLGEAVYEATRRRLV